VLHFPPENVALQAGFSHLRAALVDIAEQSKRTADVRARNGGRIDAIEWHAANRLFGQKGYAFRSPFLALMKDGFAAPFEAFDFARDADRARGKINTWAEEQTRQKIKDLIPQGALTADTRLVLVNALYLKAPWEKPFEKLATTARPFRPTPGSSRNVPTMVRTAHLGHATEDGLTVVTLDYLGSGLQFVIILPDEGTSVDAAAGRITPDHFTRWAELGKGRRQNLSLYLPKFKVEGTTLALGEALRALGVRSAFDEPRGSANFEGIAPRKANDYLAISKVFHKTFIALDEEGTEAAAATAVLMSLFGAAAEPAKPIEVRVDRPFLFAIQHRASGTCLFLGRISEP
jgi:serpin B